MIEVEKERSETARQESDRLLLNILPKDVGEEQKEKGAVEPVAYDSANVLFTDFVGFTIAAANMTPHDLIKAQFGHDYWQIRIGIHSGPIMAEFLYWKITNAHATVTKSRTGEIDARYVTALLNGSVRCYKNQSLFRENLVARNHKSVIRSNTAPRIGQIVTFPAKKFHRKQVYGESEFQQDTG